MRYCSPACLLGVLVILAAALGAQPEAAPPPKPYNPFELEIPLSDAENADVIKLRFFGQHRSRAELRSPATYAPGVPCHETRFSVNMRNRLGADALFPASVGVLFEVQDVRLFGDEPRAAANSNNASGTNSFDVLQAYLYTRNLLDLDVDARVGRQKFTIGNQRLFSTLEWAPQSRAWDGLTLRRSFDAQYHLLGMALLINELSRVQDDEWLLGATFRWTPEFLPKNEIELLLLFQHRDDVSGANDANVATSSLRWNGRFGSDDLAFVFTAEGVIQTGKADPAFWGATGKDDATVRAFAAAITADLHWKLGAHGLRFGLEWDWASGDSDPTDGRLETFRSPFPFAHRYNGFADQLGWRNLHDFGASIEWKWTIDGWVESLSLLAQAHAFQRDNDDDGWYGVTGALVRAGTPDESDELGYEVDLVVSLKVNRWTSFEIGWAHFFAGRFVKQTAAGSGSANERSDMDFVWVQLTLHF